MTILCATDFSPCSRVATRLARALARRHGDKLMLLHCIEPSPVDVPGSSVLGSGWELTMLAEAEAELERLAVEARKQDVVVETRVVVGRAAPHLLDQARALKVGLIVVGTHGRRGSARLFLGSCAETIVRGAPCPVLVAREDVGDWSRWEGTTPLRLTLAVDGSPASDAAVFWVRAIASAFPSEISLVRAYWPPEEAERYGLEAAWGGDEGNPELLRLMERDIRQQTQPLSGAHEPPLRFRISSHHTTDSLIDDARGFNADAIVLGTAKRGWTGWTGDSPAPLLRASPLPVFCVPETIRPEPRRIPRIRSLLVATDLSERSGRTVLHGYGLLPGGGRVELCHVHERSPTGSAGDFPLRALLTPAERADLEGHLRAQCPEEAAEHGITTRVHIIEELVVAEGILQAAERLEVDAIAVGSHGRTGLARVLLGSTAETVARNSPRPVFIVRQR